MGFTLSSTSSYWSKSSFPLRKLPSPSSLSNGDKVLAFLSGQPRPPNCARPLHSLSTIGSSRGRNRSPSTSTTAKNKKNLRLENDEVEKDTDVKDEDAFEALFSMLEEDLKNDDLPVGDDDNEDDEITEEEMDKLQRKLEEALGVGADDNDDYSGPEMVNDDNDGHEEEEEEERPVKLKTWQLRRLAFALKTGRRKTSIKSLAAELCLDRAVVLEYLREPPPSLVMMCAALPDEPAPRLVIPERKPVEEKRNVGDAVEKPANEVKVPVHVLRHQWSAQKRLKKVHVETLERVYKRTKRPTNAMISSIVQVTNLPRKRVVKWFEDKRNEDKVPDERLSYRRSIPESISS